MAAPAGGPQRVSEHASMNMRASYRGGDREGGQGGSFYSAGFDWNVASGGGPAWYNRTLFREGPLRAEGGICPRHGERTGRPAYALRRRVASKGVVPGPLRLTSLVL